MTKGHATKKETSNMCIKMKFKSIITTEETYPNSFIVEFVCEVHDCKDIFKEAHEFENRVTRDMKIVSCTTNCLGVLIGGIHYARTEELHQLIKDYELKHLDGSNLL